MPWLTLSGSNYPCLEQISMVPKIFEPLRFDCTLYTMEIKICSKTVLASQNTWQYINYITIFIEKCRFFSVFFFFFLFFFFPIMMSNQKCARISGAWGDQCQYEEYIEGLRRDNLLKTLTQNFNQTVNRRTDELKDRTSDQYATSGLVWTTVTRVSGVIAF